MRPTRLALSVILLLAGALWIGQGSGAVTGSAMTGSAFWEIVGAVLFVLGAVIGLRELVRPRRAKG
jgi:hypothetical protein